MPTSACSWPSAWKMSCSARASRPAKSGRSCSPLMWGLGREPDGFFGTSTSQGEGMSSSDLQHSASRQADRRMYGFACGPCATNSAWPCTKAEMALAACSLTTALELPACAISHFAYVALACLHMASTGQSQLLRSQAHMLSCYCVLRRCHASDRGLYSGVLTSQLLQSFHGICCHLGLAARGQDDISRQ